MSARLGVLRALARVELRQLRRHRGPSLLIVLLIAVPVAALVGGSALLQIVQPTSEERRTSVLGGAALRVDAGDASLDAARALLPADARVEEVRVGQEEVRAGTHRAGARFLVVEPGALDAGLARGLLLPGAGRGPEASGEVALSPVLLTVLDRAIGETVELRTGTATITGSVYDPEKLDAPVVLRAPAENVYGGGFLLADLGEAAAAEAARSLAAAGHRPTLRTELGEPDPFESAFLFVVGSFGFFEAALVVAAAFGVTLRRRQREIGLLASSGAERGGMRASLLVSAGALALVGGLIGAALGAGVAFVLHPFLDGWNGRQNGPFELSDEHLFGALALGVLTAAAAATVPAWSATRLPIRVALGGRRPVTAGSGRWLAVGLLTVAAGFSLLAFGALHKGESMSGLAILVGSMLGVLGFGGCSPWVLQRLASWAGPLPLAWRLAVRDAGRFRARNGPVVTAVLAGMSITVLLASFVASLERSTAVLPALRDDHLLVDGPGAEELAQELGRELGGVAAAPLAAAHEGGELVFARLTPDDPDERRIASWVACGGAELLHALGAERGAASLAAGRLVILAEGGSEHELIAGRERALVGHEVAFLEPDQPLRVARFVADPARFGGPRLQPGPPPGRAVTPWLVRLGTTVDDEVLARAHELAEAAAGTSVDAALLHRSPPRDFLRVVVVLCLITGLVVLLIATALSSAESAADARVLRTVGAAPSVQRHHAAARAGYLAFLGAVLAVPAGLIPAAGLLRLASVQMSFVFPWGELAITVFGLPAIAYAATWLFTRSS
ncbi:MAG: ABC transporter permease [Planctomycetota bacterium]